MISLPYYTIDKLKKNQSKYLHHFRETEPGG